MFTEEQADRFSFDVLDATKLIPEELIPVTPIGRIGHQPLDCARAEQRMRALNAG